MHNICRRNGSAHVVGGTLGTSRVQVAHGAKGVDCDDDDRRLNDNCTLLPAITPEDTFTNLSLSIIAIKHLHWAPACRSHPCPPGTLAQLAATSNHTLASNSRTTLEQ